MSRPSWSSQARELLANWQLNGFAELNVHPHEFTKVTPLMEEMILLHFNVQPGSPEHQEIISIINPDVDDLPTPYEMPMYYAMMIKAADLIEASAESLSMKIPFQPLLGTVRSGQVNATALRLRKTGEYMILFESGLLTFLSLIGKILASSLFENQKKKLFRIKTIIPEESINRFIESIYFYSVHANPHLTTPFPPDSEYLQTWKALVDAMGLFILGHEYGHIIAGHLKKAKRVASAIAGNTADEIRPVWDEEVEADAIGMQLLLNCAEKLNYDLGILAIGADCLFGTLKLFELTNEVLTTGPEGEGILRFQWEIAESEFDSCEEISEYKNSHPPPDTRCKRLKQSVENKQPRMLLKQRNRSLKKIQKIIDALWVQSRASWFEMHEKGIRPASYW